LPRVEWGIVLDESENVFCRILENADLLLDLVPLDPLVFGVSPLLRVDPLFHVVVIDAESSRVMVFPLLPNDRLLDLSLVPSGSRIDQCFDADALVDEPSNRLLAPLTAVAANAATVIGKLVHHVL